MLPPYFRQLHRQLSCSCAGRCFSRRRFRPFELLVGCPRFNKNDSKFRATTKTTTANDSHNNNDSSPTAIQFQISKKVFANSKEVFARMHTGSADLPLRSSLGDEGYTDSDGVSDRMSDSEPTTGFAGKTKLSARQLTPVEIEQSRTSNIGVGSAATADIDAATADIDAATADTGARTPSFFMTGVTSAPGCGSNMRTRAAPFFPNSTAVTADTCAGSAATADTQPRLAPYEGPYTEDGYVCCCPHIVDEWTDSEEEQYYTQSDYERPWPCPFGQWYDPADPPSVKRMKRHWPYPVDASGRAISPASWRRAEAEGTLAALLGQRAEQATIAAMSVSPPAEMLHWRRQPPREPTMWRPPPRQPTPPDMWRPPPRPPPPPRMWQWRPAPMR